MLAGLKSAFATPRRDGKWVVDEGRTYPLPGPSTPQSAGLAAAPTAPLGLGLQGPGPPLRLLGPSSLTCGW